MHKRPKMLEVHEHGPQGVPHVHNLHGNGAQSVFPRFSGMHNPHIPDAQRAPYTCRTCIRTTLRLDTSRRAGRRRDSHLPTDIEKRTFLTSDDPETTGGRLAAAPSHIRRARRPNFPRKARPGGGGRFSVQSFRGMSRLLKRTRSFGTAFANEIQLVAAARRPAPPRSRTRIL